MAVTGAGAHWRALPFPLRIAAGVLAFIILIWLARSLGGASILIAAALWIMALAGLLHATGRLAWADRHPALNRAFAAYAPRMGVARPVGPAAPAAGKSPSSTPIPTSTVKIPDISGFVGIEAPVQQIDLLIESRSALKGTLAPATFVVLAGPRGTGKTSVALVMAETLHREKIVKTGNIVSISTNDIPGLADSYGPTPEVLKSLSDHALTALDGVLLLDDLDRLSSISSGSMMLEIGSRLLAVARNHPGRLFIIGTGSREAIARLDPTNRWRGQFNFRKIDFGPLNPEALEALFVRLLTEQGFQLAPDALLTVRVGVKAIQAKESENFDNAHAMRQFVDNVLHYHGFRLRQNPGPAVSSRTNISADDVREAYSSM